MGGFLISFSCFGVNEINNRCTRWATMRRPPKQEWFYRWRPLTFFSYSSFWLFSLVLYLARVNFTTGSMRRYLDPTEVAQAVQLLQDATSILSIARRFAVSPSTVSRAWRRSRRQEVYSRRAGQGPLEGPYPIIRTGICSFVQEETGWALPEPYKMTSSRPLVWMPLTKQSETDFMRVAWGPDVL